jgi:hypothetical protein
MAFSLPRKPASAPTSHDGCGVQINDRRYSLYVQRTNVILRFEIHTGSKMKAVVFCVVTPFHLVESYQNFGQTHCLHLQDILIP